MKRRTLWLAGACAIAACAALWAQDGAPPALKGPPAGVQPGPSFAEEFDGAELDTRRWIFAYYDPARDVPSIAKRSLWGNRELQMYSDRAFLSLGIDPFELKGGKLTITARPLSEAQVEVVREAIAREPPNVRNSAIRDIRYSSGLISTRGHFAQKYGYFEMRARWSSGKGLWPAFWLLPESGRWPPEIDILEAHGDKPTTIFHSIHSMVVPTLTKRSERKATDAFHVYGALWTATTIDYYIDGVKAASIPTPGDMHQPMYLIANLAIGGSWPGNPGPDTRFPATLEIDYIRAWRLASPS